MVARPWVALVLLVLLPGCYQMSHCPREGCYVVLSVDGRADVRGRWDADDVIAFLERHDFVVPPNTLPPRGERGQEHLAILGPWQPEAAANITLALRYSVAARHYETHEEASQALDPYEAQFTPSSSDLVALVVTEMNWTVVQPFKWQSGVAVY